MTLDEARSLPHRARVAFTTPVSWFDLSAGVPHFGLVEDWPSYIGGCWRLLILHEGRHYFVALEFVERAPAFVGPPESFYPRHASV